jgi:hypothetical protein
LAIRPIRLADQRCIMLLSGCMQWPSVIKTPILRLVTMSKAAVPISLIQEVRKKKQLFWVRAYQ